MKNKEVFFGIILAIVTSACGDPDKQTATDTAKSVGSVAAQTEIGKDQMDSIFLNVQKDPENFLEYYQQSAQAYQYLGNYEQEEIGDYIQSIKYYEKALKLVDQTSSPKELTQLLQNMGESWRLKGEYDKALEYYLQALKICDKNPNPELTAFSSYVLTGIGILYRYRGDCDKAEEYFLKNYSVVENSKEKIKIVNALNNLGIVYRCQKNPEEALNKYNEALQISKEINDKKSTADIYNNIGVIRYGQEDYKNCLIYFMNALEINLIIRNENKNKGGGKNKNENEIAISQRLNNIGIIYRELKKYEKAIFYHRKSLELAKNLQAKQPMKEAYVDLAKTYKLMGIFKEAYEFHVLYTQIKDSLFTIESSKQIAEMQTKYETGKKEHQIELQKSELDKKDAEARNMTMQLWAAIAAIFLAVFISVREWRSRQRTKKANILLAKQRADLAEKNKDITDSIRYAQRIQDAILPSTEYCNKVLPQHFILYKPHSIVSGDFYWMYDTSPRPSPRSAAEALERNRQGEGDPPSGPEKTSAHKVIWIAADCTGHGVPGAFMSMIGNSLLNEIVVEKGITTPGVILDELKSGIINALGQTGAADQSRDGMDAALCVWDKKSNVLEFAGAYNPLYLVRKGIAHSKLGQNGTIQYYGDDLAEIKADRQPIAYEEGKEAPFTTHQIQLQKGDVIYTFSDGIQDQFGGPKTKKFTAKRLKETLVSMQSTPIPEQKEKLNEIIEEWKGEEEQIDDIVLIGVKVG